MPSKISRLRDTEVANFAHLPFLKKMHALRSIETPKVTWGYQPVRNCLPALLLADTGLFGDLPSGSDKALIKSVEDQCKQPRQVISNVAVATAILEWRKTNGVFSRIVDSPSYPTPTGGLRFWSNVVPIVNGRPTIIHLDCSANLNLNAMGKEFMKSLIHHSARVADLRDADVAILRTPTAGPGLRNCVLEPLIGEPRYELEEIDRMVEEVYTAWELILRERRIDDDDQKGAGSLI